MGPEHDAFEDELAAFLGVGHCLGVASGTDALELALLGVGCEAGDEVVDRGELRRLRHGGRAQLGLRVRFADVDPVDAVARRPRRVEPALDAGHEGRRRHPPLRPRRRVEAIAVLCRRARHRR